MNLLQPTLSLLAQTDDYGAGAAQGGGIVSTLIGLVVVIAMIAALWMIFDKAGQPGWASIVPIYNLYILCVIVGRPWWWTLLMLIPVLNIIFLIIVYIDLAKSFGKGVGFGLGMIFLPFLFMPMLAFGSAQYEGQAAG